MAKKATAAGKTRTVERAPLLPMWALLLGAFVVALIGDLSLFLRHQQLRASAARQVSVLRHFRPQHRSYLGFHRHPESGPGGLFRHRRLLRRAVAEDQLRHRASHPLRQQVSRFHGMERADGTAGLHDAAHQHAFRRRLRRHHPDPARLHLRRDHLQAAHLRGLLRGHHARRSADPAGVHHRVSGLHRRVQRHHRLRELCRRAVPVVHIVRHGGVLSDRPLHNPFPHRNGAQVDPRQRRSRRVHGLQRRQLPHLRVLRVGLHGGGGGRHVCRLGRYRVLPRHRPAAFGRRGDLDRGRAGAPRSSAPSSAPSW